MLQLLATTAKNAGSFDKIVMNLYITSNVNLKAKPILQFFV